MAPAVHRAQNKGVVAEPSTDEAPDCNQDGICDQNNPEVSSAEEEERHINANVVRSVRQGDQSN